MTSYKGLRSQISSISRKRPIPGVVIDVLGTRCSIRLSNRGALVTNLAYTGQKPKVGDAIFVDYSGRVPIVITSDSTEVVTPIEATSIPVVTAVKAVSATATELPVTLDVLYTSILKIPISVHEDLTSQITGSNAHFTLSDIPLLSPVLICNIQQSPNVLMMDSSGLGFTLTFTPTMRDVLMVDYFKAGIL